MSTIAVTVVLALPDRAVEMHLELPEGATVADALACFAARGIGVDIASAPVGLWGRRIERSHALVDGDRLEIYRPLVADPKSARRRRARKPAAD